jgi:hypothetical protein
MGIGRTGTVASCVFIELGLETADALRVVERGGSNPEVTQRSFRRGLLLGGEVGRPADPSLR